MFIYVRNTPQAIVRNRDVVVDYLEGRAASTVDTDVAHRLVQRLGVPDDRAVDLILLAAAVYVGDKRVLRQPTDDGWMRTLRVNVPTSDRSTWLGAKEPTEALLQFLTGDRWSVTFRRGATRLRPVLSPLPLDRHDAVCLFSGGLDSCVGAIDLLEEGRRVVLIGHYDALHTKRDQRQVFEALVDHYGQDRVVLIQVRLRPAPRRAAQEFPLPTPVERTTRSRSLVFLSLGIAGATALDEHAPLFVPENGFISLNVPLSTTRVGSLSTRTTHPRTLHLFRSILRRIGIENPVLSPYETRTKGEMLEQCKNQRLLQDVVRRTVSCSHPEVLRWKRRGYGHCGYCLPCIVRRAAMWRVGWSEDCLVDVRRVPEKNVPTGASDLKAVKMAMKTWKHGDRRIHWNGRIPLRKEETTALDDVRMRGIEEIRTFLSS